MMAAAVPGLALRSVIVYGAELALPRMHVIYTVPVYVKPIGWGGQIWPVLNVKVRERDGSDCREGIDLLRRVLARRAPDGDPERLLIEIGRASCRERV